MNGKNTGEIGKKLEEKIRDKFRHRPYEVCIDHAESGENKCVAVGEIATADGDYIQISHIDIAVLESYEKPIDGYAGRAIVLCEIEEKCKGNVKIICGDILSMCILGRVRVVAKGGTADKYYSCGRQKVIMAYYDDIDNVKIDSERWKPLKTAVQKRINDKDQHVQIIRTSPGNMNKELVNCVIEYLKNQ